MIRMRRAGRPLSYGLDGPDFSRQVPGNRSVNQIPVQPDHRVDVGLPRVVFFADRVADHLAAIRMRLTSRNSWQFAGLTGYFPELLPRDVVDPALLFHPGEKQRIDFRVNRRRFDFVSVYARSPG